jgi:ferredoxin-type protein NapH
MEVIRKWVQTLFFFLTNGYWSFPFTRAIYKGPLKVICSPGLNCYSCPAATTYCPIGSLQQLLGGIRLALETGQFYIGFYVVGVMGLIGASVGRIVCAWVCPFGLFQELLHKIPSPKYGIWPILKYGKYGMLLFMVILLPLFAIDSFGNGDPWFCKYFCPAGTLEAGLPMIFLRPALQDKLGALFLLKLSILLFFLGWSVIASRPFCRTACPLGAFYALFSRMKLVKLGLDHNNCNHCGACHDVCPMGVRFNESPNDMECISCMSCSKICKRNAIRIEVGGLPVSGQQKAPKSNSI